MMSSGEDVNSSTCLYHTSVTHNSLVQIRKRNVIISTSLLMIVSGAGFGISLAAYLYTSNVKAGAFWAQIAMVLASIFVLIGVLQNSEGKSWMIAGLFLCGVSILVVIIGAIVDAVQAGHILNSDLSQCVYRVSAGDKICYSGCKIKHGSRSCICCQLQVYKFCNGPVSWMSSQPTTYDGVQSCRHVETVFQKMLWSSCALCCASCVVGIVTCALVSLYKSAVTITIVPVNSLTSRSILGSSNPFIIFSTSDTITYNPSGPFPPPYCIAMGQPLPPPPSTPTPPPSRNTFRIGHGAAGPSTSSGRVRDNRSEKRRWPDFYNDYYDENEPPPPYVSPPPPID